MNSEVFPLIQIEIDLMRAAGFTLVLCANYYQKAKDYFFRFINDDQFSEIHINFPTKSSLSDFQRFLMESKARKNVHFQNFQGYIYFYSLFLKNLSEAYKIYAQLKKWPRINFIQFSKNISESLKGVNCRFTRPFSYCKCGFKYKKIRVVLSNAPIFEYADDEYTNGDDCPSFIPTQTSELSIAYVSADHFLNWSKKRVKITFEDQTEVGYHHRYINFEDLHKVTKEIYVTDSLSLVNTDQKDIEKVDEIERAINEIKKTGIKKNMAMDIFYKLIRKMTLKFSKDQISNCFYVYYLISSQANYEFNIISLFLYS